MGLRNFKELGLPVFSVRIGVSTPPTRQAFLALRVDAHLIPLTLVARCLPASPPLGPATHPSDHMLITVPWVEPLDLLSGPAHSHRFYTTVQKTLPTLAQLLSENFLFKVREMFLSVYDQAMD